MKDIVIVVKSGKVREFYVDDVTRLLEARVVDLDTGLLSDIESCNGYMADDVVATLEGKRQFRVGDPVRIAVKPQNPSAPPVGAVGTVREIIEGANKARILGIEFRQHFPGGHNLVTDSVTGYGWWCAPDVLELVEETTPDADFRIEMRAWTEKLEVALSSASTAEQMQALEEAVAEIRRMAQVGETQAKARVQTNSMNPVRSARKGEGD